MRKVLHTAAFFVFWMLVGLGMFGNIFVPVQGYDWHIGNIANLPIAAWQITPYASIAWTIMSLAFSILVVWGPRLRS